MGSSGEALGAAQGTSQRRNSLDTRSSVARDTAGGACTGSSSTALGAALVSSARRSLSTLHSSAPATQPRACRRSTALLPRAPTPATQSPCQ